jgi:uncharacterized protein (UPF0262 family)
MINFMKGFRYLLATMVVLYLMTIVFAFASVPVKTVAHYKVSSMGLNIGDVATTQRMTEDGGVPSLKFETRTAVKASFLWMGYHQDTIEKGTLQKRDLISYSRKGQENGVTIDIEGRLEHSSFRFEVREHGTVRYIVIPRSSYDFTTMECPEARLDFSDNTPVTLNILDVEKMSVVKRNYRLIRNTHYTVAENEYPCRIIDYSDQNKKARRWIAWDGSTVLMYRQDGKGEKNTYSVQATSVTKEM